MATRAVGSALGCADNHDHLEAGRLKLGAEHIPFPCSLRELVLDRYGEPPGVGANAHPMQMSELIDYLKKVDNFALSPWVAVVGLTEAMGDPATPSREQVAILRWLGKALEIWEKQFPLEPRIAAQVRRLKPLSAAFAVMDPWFLQPGAHPLHQLLDVIQARAIGWQARLDRVGAVLEQQVTKAVDDARTWFENGSVDLTGICAEFTAAAERDQARAQRMVQRVIEAEAGKVKTTTAKQEAARMINALLAQRPATPEIGNFIKGPWFTSAQLLFLKHGADSDEWRSMCATTATLLDSLQNIEEEDEGRRQQLFEIVTQLPKDMRRWLLSLHHDTEAVNEAMGLVEFTHLKILRRQTLDRKIIDPIVVEGDHTDAREAQNLRMLNNWQEGQWFSVNTDTDGIIRMQLVLKVESSRQLVFTNLAGLKVLQLSFAEFAHLAEQKKVQPLYSGASFSLCLAQAVGIDSVEIMDALVSALAENESLANASAQATTQTAATAQPREQEAQPVAGPELEVELDLELETPQDPAASPEVTTDDVSVFEDEPPEEIILSVPAEPFDHQPAIPEYEATELAIPGRSVPASDPPGRDRANRQPATPARSSGGTLFDQAQEIKARGGYVIQPADPADTFPIAPTRTHPESNFITAGARGRSLSKDFQDGPGDAREGLATTRQGEGDDRQINLPMGAWLGFHDGEIPLLAKLAVHDTEDDYFIFVNRKGVKVRKVSRLELLELIDAGLVELLQATSSFRNAVSAIRNNVDQ